MVPDGPEPRAQATLIQFARAKPSDCWLRRRGSAPCRNCGGATAFTPCFADHATAALAPAGAIPLNGNLDQPASLACLARARRLCAASCAAAGSRSARHAHQEPSGRAGAGKKSPQRLVYVSTSGLWRLPGARVDESRRPHPETARAVRRLDAERQLRRFGRLTGVTVSLLRAPGIYASDRLPLARLKKACRRWSRPTMCSPTISMPMIWPPPAARRSDMGSGPRLQCLRRFTAADGRLLRLRCRRLRLPRPPRLSRVEELSGAAAGSTVVHARIAPPVEPAPEKELKLHFTYADVTAGIAAARQETRQKQNLQRKERENECS